MDITKNDEYTLAIDGYTSEGCGVGRINGYPVFIPMTVRGDIVKAKIVKAEKNYAYGKCIDILKPSDKRKEPICPHYFKCGGCAVMHMSDEEQAFFKKNKVENAFLHIAGINVSAEETVTGNSIGYRNKIQMPVAEDYTQAMYKTRSNTKVSVPSCVLQDERTRRVAKIILSYLEKNSVKPYDTVTREGVVRHIYTRISAYSGEILAVVVATEKITLLPLKEELQNAGVSGLILNINKNTTNKILGEKSYLIFGSDHITDRLCGTDFNIYKDSFFQVNQFLTERLYNKAVKLADLGKDETVFDLYCGAGTLTAALAKQAGLVYGVEIVPSAVKSARESLDKAGITNAKIILGEAEKEAPRLIREGIVPPCVLVDPPRKGCGNELISMLLDIKCPKIVYVSCDPATLARDVKKLSDGGYTLKSVHPFDMFPFTHHVECVVLMTKVQN